MIDRKQPILFYLISTYLITSICLIGTKNDLINAIAQAIPGLTALFLILVIQKQKISAIKQLGLFNLGHLKWSLFAIIIPFTAIAMAYGLAVILGLVKLEFIFSLKWLFTLNWHYLILIFSWPFIWAMGEELGWRGYLQPQLTSIFGIKKGLLATGIIWATWHYNFIFISNYYEGGNIIIDTVLLSITVLLMGVVIGWLRIQSNSLWPCVIFHSASNGAWQIVPYQFQVVNPNFIYVAGEAGLGNIIFWLIVVAIIWPSVNRLETARSGNSY